MPVPGSNILTMALSAIAAQQITYLAFVSRSTNSIGMQVPVYASPVMIRGSIQPVPRELMERLGLEFQKNYVRIFAPNNLIDIARDVSSDKFQFSGVTYQGLSLTKWFSVDSWNEILAIQVPS